MIPDQPPFSKKSLILFLKKKCFTSIDRKTVNSMVCIVKLDILESIVFRDLPDLLRICFILLNINHNVIVSLTG